LLGTREGDAMKSTGIAIILCLALSTMCSLSANRSAVAYHIPAPLKTIKGTDFSTWEQVCEPGFGNDDNMAVVALAEYNGRLYAMVRNDVLGVSVWRTSGESWEQVQFSNGINNGVYGNFLLNSHMGSMTVFKDKLYCGFSSGIQGSFLKSTGCEIWRYDGNTWEPVISDKKDTDESGTITAIAGCSESDGDTTAQFTDDSKAWLENQWAGGVLQITSGSGVFRRFDIIGNTENTLQVQQNEIAGERGIEYTICSSKHYKNPFPPHEYDLGPVAIGDRYEIGTGYDENGFGDYWNKVTTTLTIFQNKLYATTALNYEYGGQVWYTEDGDNWFVTEPSRSFGLFHTDPNYPNAQKPVSRGIPAIGACSVSGTEALYGGTLGSEGNLGSCARFARLTDDGWKLIVDTSVDDNDTGTNENGFGGGLNCTMYNGNFNVWSIACFRNELFVGFQSLGGTRVLYSTTGSSEDGSWSYSVGGDSTLPCGFDGVIIPASPGLGTEKLYKHIAVNLFTFTEYLYAGLIVVPPTMGGMSTDYLRGSQIWKTRDGRAWEPVTNDGFGDNNVLTFEAFAVFNNTLYVAASRASNTVGIGLGGAKIFRLVPAAACSIERAVLRYTMMLPNRDTVFIEGTVTPQTTFDPLTEEISVIVQSAQNQLIFTDTLPAGAFKKLAPGDTMVFYRKQPGVNSKIDVMTLNLTTGKFFVFAKNESLNRLPVTEAQTVDVTVGVSIGNDSGAATNAFTVSKATPAGVPKKLIFNGMLKGSTSIR